MASNLSSPSKIPRLAEEEERANNESEPEDMFSDDSANNELPNGEEDEFSQLLASQSFPWSSWSVAEVATYLSQNGIPDSAVRAFKDNRIDGCILEEIAEQQEKYLEDKLNIRELGTQLKIQKVLKGLISATTSNLSVERNKVFNDPVHGHMEFHPLIVAVIDTPEFQRLRNLKQLGFCYYVYPGAGHNRFEHSLGVCHLAGQLVEALRARQPGLCITNEDVLCIQIAGLCHDLGHGPFSHFFDNIFIPHVRPDFKWKHEDASVEMFEHLLEKNKLKEKFATYNLNRERILFIKELIDNKPRGKEITKTLKQFCYGDKKSFLYEIVANKKNGVDVDKWDYFKRDCYHLGIHSSFDHSRFIKFSRVIDVKNEKTGRNELQICVREKEAFNMYQMFQTRHALHRKAYQHRVVQAIGIMFLDAFEKADTSTRIPGDDGRKWKMSECVEHMSAYTRLTDSILQSIMMSDNSDADMKEAQRILGDFQKRKMYWCIGESMPVSQSEPIEDDKETIEKVKKEILDTLSSERAELERLELNTERLAVMVANLNFGRKEDNPVDEIRFFTKNKLNKAVAVKASEVSLTLPQFHFQEQIVRLFLRPCEDDDQNRRCMELLHKGFKYWCRTKKSMRDPKLFFK